MAAHGALPIFSCPQLLRTVPLREPPVGEGPVLRDHPAIEIHPRGPAHCHGPAVVVPITFLACNGASADPIRKRPRRLAVAQPALAPSPAPLLALRSVDPVQANPNSAHVERIAVDHPRGTRERTTTTGNSTRLFLRGFLRPFRIRLQSLPVDFEARASASRTSPTSARASCPT